MISLGGRFGPKDQGQTPNTQLAIYDFGPCKLLFEVRGLVVGGTKKVTNEFYLEEGVIKGGDARREVLSARLRQARRVCQGRDYVTPSRRQPGQVEHHFANFINCVRSRRQDHLNADILEGHLRRPVPLGKCLYRRGEDVPFNQQTKALGDDNAPTKPWKT